MLPSAPLCPFIDAHGSTENLLASTTTSTTPLSTCATCGTFKSSGKLSCCARGGDWFNKCGDPGDSKFDHTWFEGIQACKDVTKEAQSQSILPHQISIAQQQNHTQQQTGDSAVPVAAGITYNSVAFLICILFMNPAM